MKKCYGYILRLYRHLMLQKNKLEIPIIYKLKVFLRPPHLETRRESFVCKRINEEAVKIMNFSSFIITLTRVTDDKERIKLKKQKYLNLTMV